MEPAQCLPHCIDPTASIVLMVLSISASGPKPSPHRLRINDGTSESTAWLAQCNNVPSLRFRPHATGICRIPIFSTTSRIPWFPQRRDKMASLRRALLTAKTSMTTEISIPVGRLTKHCSRPVHPDHSDLLILENAQLEEARARRGWSLRGGPCDGPSLSTSTCRRTSDPVFGPPGHPQAASVTAVSRWTPMSTHLTAARSPSS